jgi:type II secretory pathway component GspD/PulD (secretin)
MILGLTLALAFGGSGARGQTNSVPSPQAGLKTYRLTYTLTETDGGKRVGTQHFAMIVVSGRKTVLKQGNRVPLVTGSVSTSGGAQTQVQYLDIGLNIDASIEESADGVKLNTQVEQSSIAEEKSGFGTQDPIVRQAKLEGTSILTAGKPLILGSMDIPSTTRRLDIEVVMEHVGTMTQAHNREVPGPQGAADATGP